MNKFLISLTLILFFAFTGCASKPKQDVTTTVVAPTPFPPQHYVADVKFHPRAKDPAFVKDHPKVCFDEGHHNLAVLRGFYQPVLELLESDGYQVVRRHERFTSKMLRECKILYISAAMGTEEMSEHKKAAHSAFDDEEIHSIVKWVFAGGSLIVMTDHKPMSNAADRLLGQFKVKGSIVTVANEQHPIAPFKDSEIFSLQGNQLDEKSAIILGRNENELIRNVFWFYGQALQAPKKAEAFLKFGDGTKMGGKNGDPEVAADKYPAGALAFKYKKGRVVVFGDATVFTSKLDLELNENAGINREGSDNVQLVLNVFHWLSGLLTDTNDLKIK